jgi:ATP-dependent RNA helicase DeaD
VSSARDHSQRAGFAGIGIVDSLVATVTSLGYEEPTPVQRETIPVMLSSRDLLAQAATGTGKTAAFALPLIQRLIEEPKGRHRTRGLVLVPTRELAMQVAESIHKYARGTTLHVVPVYGGASMQQQTRALERGADIVVATPGRALDHLRRKTLTLDALLVLVLDEADEMLDMGFSEDIDTILKSTPATRQTTLFSATLPARILSIAAKHLRDPQRIAVAREKTAAGKLPRVRQVAYLVHRSQKPEVLGRVLDVEGPTSAIVFCRTRLDVDTLVERLNSHGYRAEALHGGMEQRQRDAVMNRFRAAKADLLVATDVAARGLDIKHLSHVVNYDLPASADDYVHRIGRTGRAGREGTAITLADPREQRLLRNIEQVTKQKIEIATVPTLSDLRARRLEQTRTALRERLLAGELDDVRGVVESLSAEFSVNDIAAAAVKLAHAATVGDRPGKDDKELPPPPPARTAGPARFSGGKRIPRPQPGDARPRREPQAPSDNVDVVRLFIGAGRQAGIRPGDLVGAITGETGISSKELGAIEIADKFSLVDVPDAIADQIIEAMKKTTLRGQKVSVRRSRESPPQK